MSYFVDIKARLNRIKRINQVRMLNNVFAQGNVGIYVENLIKFEQLFKGIDGTGKSLASIGGGYADSTIIKKARKGQPTDRVTLFDKGDYYDSIFMIVPSGNETRIILESDPIKGDDYDLRRDWGGNLTEITGENKSKLSNFILPMLRQSFLDTWSGRN